MNQTINQNDKDIEHKTKFINKLPNILTNLISNNQ